jgi:hypothetical protein
LAENATDRKGERAALDGGVPASIRPDRLSYIGTARSMLLHPTAGAPADTRFISGKASNAVRESLMRHAVSMELYAHWNALRGGRTAPERNEIEPGAIRSVLADTFLLEFDAGGEFPLRISGSRVNALFLRELRGLSFLKLWRASDRSEIVSVLRRVADKAQPYLLGAEARPSGLPPLAIEVTLLPLRHKGSTHSRVLGSLAADAGADWFGFVGSGPATLTSVKAVSPSAPAPALATPGPGPSLSARAGGLFVSLGTHDASRHGSFSV